MSEELGGELPEVHPERPEEDSEPPPLFGTWRTAYVVVLLNLLAMMIALYAFQRYFG